MQFLFIVMDLTGDLFVDEAIMEGVTDVKAVKDTDGNNDADLDVVNETDGEDDVDFDAVGDAYEEGDAERETDALGVMDEETGGELVVLLEAVAVLDWEGETVRELE